MLFAHGVSPAAGLVQVSLVLCGLLGLLFVLKRTISSRADPSARGRAIPLTSAHNLHVVEVEGRRFLIGTGPQSAPTLLDELDPAPEQRSRAERPRSDPGDV